MLNRIFDLAKIQQAITNFSEPVKKQYYDYLLHEFGVLFTFHSNRIEGTNNMLTLNDTIYYIAGDTDITEENKQVKCDVTFVPIGGTYTMDYKEAAELINEIKPKIAVPTHYAAIVGAKEDGENFVKLLDSEIECKIYIK